MVRVNYEALLSAIKKQFINEGMEEERAHLCAKLFADASLDGVASHGLNRVPRFLEYIRKGYVDIHASPELVFQRGMIEQWDGKLGPGNLNAWFCMDRAIQLAKVHGIALVAQRNTNHWMRGGNYGWQAAEAGCIGICFTNTMPNMPAWGAKDPIIGNNPIIIALPRANGPIVFDAAMSQFSFGKIESYRLQGRSLPVEGGFDSEGHPTKDPAEIEASGRVLPFGYWKGSGLAILLDLLAATLANGLTTIQIGAQNKDEYGLSQVFIAIDPSIFGGNYQELLDHTVISLHEATPVQPGTSISYPGERTLKTRAENLKLGVPVDERYWGTVDV